MPPRGNDGLDFTPILTHYLFLFTTAAAVLGWFVAFIGQIVSTALFGNDVVGVLWFAVFLQLFLIAGVIYTLASDSIALHRFQISIFGAIAIVFSVFGVQQGIYSGRASLDAMSVGWLILAIIDILWVLYFTAEDDSLVLHIFNSLGTGGLTPPSRRRRTRAGNSMHMQGNNYSNAYTSGGSPEGYDPKLMTGVGSVSPGGVVRSQNSFAGSQDGNPNKSMGGVAGIVQSSPPGGADTSLRQDNVGQNSPLMAGIGAGQGIGGNSESMQPPDHGLPPDSHIYKAKAMYAYSASPDDPNEISFVKGEIMDIIDKQGKWWQARRTDGSIGIAPSNYLQLV